MKRVVLILLISFLVSQTIEAQLSFPNGKNLKLITNQSDLYFETQILFYTGKFNIVDYEYQKISAVLDKNWDHSACFNGFCKTALEQTGNFEKLASDTTGFIAFHVFTHSIIGNTKIQYSIYNKKDTADHALLTFDITYAPGTGIEEDNLTTSLFKVYPNPSSDFVNLSFPEFKKVIKIEVLNLTGQTIYQSIIPAGNTNLTIQTKDISKGVYIVKVNSETQVFFQRMVIQ